MGNKSYDCGYIIRRNDDVRIPVSAEAIAMQVALANKKAIANAALDDANAYCFFHFAAVNNGPALCG